MSARFMFMNQRPPVNVSVLPSKSCDPFEEYRDEKFLKEFRMTKSEANFLCHLVKDDMPCMGHRQTDLNLQQKVLGLFENAWFWKFSELLQRFR